MNTSKIHVDTVHLVATINADITTYIFDNFKMGAGKNYRYTTTESDPYFRLDIHNKKPYANRYYNAILVLQRKSLKDIPEKLVRLLNMTDWKVKRMDVAFDFVTPTSKHFILKSHGNVKIKDEDAKRKYGDNYYMYSDKSKNRAIIYDKKKQLAQKDIHINEPHLTRFEVRILPKLNEQHPIMDLDFEWTKRYFDKFTFVPNIDNLPLKKGDKDTLHNIMRRKNKGWNGISRTKKTELKQVVTDNAINLFEEFDNNKTDLFGWLFLNVDSTLVTS